MAKANPNSAAAPEQAGELRAEERLIADEKEVGVEVVIVYPSCRMDFKAAFTSSVLYSWELKH